jgi:SAM-dependent methyltransferase
VNFRGGRSDSIYEYDGQIYPTYLLNGDACRFIAPIALHFCKGSGLDVGAGRWPLPGATPVDLSNGGDAMALPSGKFDYIVSSHCLEHLVDPVSALEHWKTRLKPGGVLFLYLPSTAMRYWQTTRNRKHLHEWEPGQMVRILRDLGFWDVLHSERDLAWSFSCVGFNP